MTTKKQYTVDLKSFRVEAENEAKAIEVAQRELARQYFIPEVEAVFETE